MIDIKTFIRKNILALTPYSTARDEYQGDIGIYLDANENPYDNSYNRYPDPHQKELKAKIAQLKGCDAENIFIGNGSDEAIDLAYRVFCEPRIDNVVSIAPTYGMYKVAAGINDVEFREVQLGVNFSLDVNALLAATDFHTKLIFICSPNNPTANSFAYEDILLLINNFNGIIVLDEAYIDFSSRASLLANLSDHPNLIILQTLSKAWGMAGLRLGLAFGAREIIDIFSRVKYPYNINVAAQRVVIKQLENPVDHQVQEIIEQRDMVITALTKCDIVRRVYPSDANFVLIEVEKPTELYNLLIDNGVIVRDRSRITSCQGCLRITIGTPEENNKMIQILQNIKR